MTREEILDKSRKENNDEGLTAAEHKGRFLGIQVLCIVFIFVVICNLISGQNSYGPMAMFWAYVAAEAFPKYRFTKKKTFLVATVACATATVANLASFLVAMVG